MKKQIFIAALGLIGLLGHSQNTNTPWSTTQAQIGIGTGSPITKFGKQLMTISNDSQAGSTDIDLSGLNAGIYFLSADGKTIQKIIKN